MWTHYEGEFRISGDFVSVMAITEDCDNESGGGRETGALARPSGPEKLHDYESTISSLPSTATCAMNESGAWWKLF